MADFDPSIAALLLRLLSSLSIEDTSFLTRCMQIHHAMSGRLATLDNTAVMSAYKALQKRTNPRSKADFEDSFTQLLSKDTGGFGFIIAEIGKYMNDPIVAAMQPKELASVVHAEPHSQDKDSSTVRKTQTSQPSAQAPLAKAVPTSAEPTVMARASAGVPRPIPSSAPLAAEGRVALPRNGPATSASSSHASHTGQLLLKCAQACIETRMEVKSTDDIALCFGDYVLLRSCHISSGCFAFTYSSKERRYSAHSHSTGIGQDTEVFQLLPVLTGRSKHDGIRNGDLVVLKHMHTSQFVCTSSSLKPSAGSSDSLGLVLAADPDYSNAFLVYAPDVSLSDGKPKQLTTNDAVCLLNTAGSAKGADLLELHRNAVVRSMALTASKMDGSRGCASSIFCDSLADSIRSDPLAAPPLNARWRLQHVTRYAQSKSISLYAHAYLPDWSVKSTPPSTRVFRAAADRLGPSAPLSLHLQESLLVHMLLHSLLGNADGSFTTSDGKSWTLPTHIPIGHASVAIDASLRTLAEQILPVGYMFSLVQQETRALRSTQAGAVVSALIAAVQTITNEYSQLVLEIERLAKANVKAVDSKAALDGPRLTPSLRFGNSPQTAKQPAVIWDISLQRLWFYLQPSSRTMSVLHSILISCRGLRGGALLAALARCVTTSGEAVSRSLSTFLLEKAAQPWLQILEKWIFAGLIDDPFSEFMIEEQVDVTVEGLASDARNRYWDTRFQVRKDHIPPFLQPHVQSIMASGKYLHVLRLCTSIGENKAAEGVHVRRPIGAPIQATPIGSGVKKAASTSTPPETPARSTSASRVEQSRLIHKVAPYASKIAFVGLDPDAYAAKLHHAAAAASQALMSIFTKSRAEGGLALLSRLNTMKSFFLVARGDFLTHFLDNAEVELTKELAPKMIHQPSVDLSSVNPAAIVSVYRLRNVFELALRNTTADADPHKSEMQCILSPTSLLAQVEALRAEAEGAGVSSSTRSSTSGLKGYNSFCLDYNVQWPLSVVLSRHAISRYQLLFRNVLFAKYVERAVCQCWIAHQSCKELGMRDILALSFALRQRMLHFLQNLIYYNLAEVIEPRWHTMMLKLQSAAGLEDIIQAHEEFLQTSLDECLLTSHDMLKLQTKLVTLCLLFSHQITQSIEQHRLSEAELDVKAGLNKASKRAREQFEKGEYYAEDEDDDDDGKSVSSRTSRASSRRFSAAVSSKSLSNEGAAALKDRLRRKMRIQTQTDAMKHTMAQQGWQAMIVKSSRMFDSLLKEFLAVLTTKARGNFESHLVHLCERLDYNTFYSTHLGVSVTIST